MAGDVPIQCRIAALMQERNRLFAYPHEHLASGIRSTGFRCDRCGACCTRVVNGAVFILDHELAGILAIDPAACEPAPDPAFCDQNGTLYGSGYALRTKKDGPGSCWFLDDHVCGIYNRRLSGCRIYPHMLRRGTGAGGNVSWRTFARWKEHGKYDTTPAAEEALGLAREIKEYENAFLAQQISFLETVHEHFALHGLWHDPLGFREQLHRFRNGAPVEVKVFHAGELESCRMAGPGFPI